MDQLFPKETYQRRREILAGAITDGIAFIPGNGESPMNYSANPYPFRQDSCFLYYFGIDRPNLYAAIDCNSGESILFGNERSVGEVVWMGETESLQSLREKLGISRVVSLDRMENYFKESRAHILPPYRPEHISGIMSAFGNDKTHTLSESFISAVVKQRSIKEESEIAEMEKALEITSRMHLAVMRGSRAGATESKLAAEAQEIAFAEGCLLAYPIILSVDGQILHNHHHTNTLQPGHMLLGDFGAESQMHYAADITRTTPVGLQFTDRQKDIYSIVLDSQVAAIDMLREGVRFKDVHLQAARVIASGLKDIGLMKGDMEDAIREGAHALFFPHGLGHMIGLDVHDMEALGEDFVGYDMNVQRNEQFGLSALRMGRELQTGMVVTVEPGIYFIPALMEQWKKEGKHRNFIAFGKLTPYLSFGGIRIEDNVLIEGSGARILGPDIPKKIAEIESL